MQNLVSLVKSYAPKPSQAPSARQAAGNDQTQASQGTQGAFESMLDGNADAAQDRVRAARAEAAGKSRPARSNDDATRADRRDERHRRQHKADGR